MVDSGIRVATECTNLAHKIEKKGLDGMICIIEKSERTQNKDQVVCHKEHQKDPSLDPKAQWQAFANECMEYKICYGISFVNWTSKDNRPCDKLVFVFWNGEDAVTRDRMKYSSTKDTLKKSIKTISNIIQASDKEEFAYELIVDTVSKGDHNLKL